MSHINEQNKHLEDRIAELESRLAFQDDTIEQLNQALATQQQDMDKLRHQMGLIATRMKEMVVSQIASQSEETPPPHY